MRLIQPTSIILTFLLSLLLVTSCDREKVIILNPTTVENLIEKYTPIHLRLSIALIELSDPLIRLNDDQIKLNLQFTVSWLDQFFDGRIRLQGKLNYDPPTTSFFFNEFKINDIDFNRVPKELEEDVYGQEGQKKDTEFKLALIETTTAAFNKYLKDKPAFTLKSMPQLASKLGKKNLDRIEVRKNKLKLYLRNN